MSTEQCIHADTWFDRVVCPEPCGGMHEYCSDCGHPVRGCLIDEPVVNEEVPDLSNGRPVGYPAATRTAHLSHVHLPLTDWRGRNVRIFPGWDVLRRAPFVEGHVVSLRPAMWVVRDAEGVEQEWPVTLPIEEA